jgi:hypothetical protein
VRRSGELDAGPFAADIASFRLHLAAENKAAGTIRIYTDAACWFATSHLLWRDLFVAVVPGVFGQLKQVKAGGCPRLAEDDAARVPRAARPFRLPPLPRPANWPPGQDDLPSPSYG